MTTCSWDEGGSRRLLLDFIPETTLKNACAYFNLTVSSNSFLGSGAFGFVFRAQRADGVDVALKIVLKSHGGTGGPDKNVERLSFEKQKMLRAKELCPDEVMGLEEDCLMSLKMVLRCSCPRWATTSRASPLSPLWTR